jgi:hypothetical protein
VDVVIAFIIFFGSAIMTVLGLFFTSIPGTLSTLHTHLIHHQEGYGALVDAADDSPIVLEKKVTTTHFFVF